MLEMCEKKIYALSERLKTYHDTEAKVIALFAIGLSIANSDGDISKSEREMLDALVFLAMPSNIHFNIKEKIDKLLEKPPLIDEAIQLAHQSKLSSQDIDDIMYLVIWADRNFSWWEQNFKDRWKLLYGEYSFKKLNNLQKDRPAVIEETTDANNDSGEFLENSVCRQVQEIDGAWSPLASSQQNVDASKFKGEHLWVDRMGYTHHGISTGKGTVIHYSGLAEGLSSGPVKEVSLSKFSGGESVYVKSHPGRKFSEDDAVERARNRLGENAYSVFGNNCEHFVEWCIEGKHSSEQVDKGVKVATGGTAVAAGVGGVGVVSSAGAVAGLSGSGVMSGLASVGGCVAGGAVAGVGVLAAAGGLGMATLLNNTVLKGEGGLPAGEREARQVGRVATYTGAVAGTAGGVAAISAAGATAGLSAAGITSGLAAIGGTVGGGMVAGTAAVVAGPVVAATAIGYGAYKLWQWIAD